MSYLIELCSAVLSSATSVAAIAMAMVSPSTTVLSVALWKFGRLEHRHASRYEPHIHAHEHQDALKHSHTHTHR
ncbi:MAG: hypothetical protein WB440_01590 [Steroidobacteraceae bacterium]